MKYIKKIGVEIEGGWDKKPPDTEIYGDGSVDVDCNFQDGEISSPPMTLRELLQWIVRNYPQHTNNTCGLHIHISFKKNIYYSKLMSQEFYDYFLARITEWANREQILPSSPFWSRLRGENGYCKKIFRADEQVHLTNKESARYTHLNYCFSLHRTLECRLFPTFKSAKLAQSAVKAFIEIVETFLSKQGREKTYKVNIDEETGTEKIIIEDVYEDNKQKEVIQECVL